ncbi:hypothetical protein BC567DRAFT_219657 [Phyllosticta citribraziliensis]
MLHSQASQPVGQSAAAVCVCLFSPSSHQGYPLLFLVRPLLFCLYVCVRAWSNQRMYLPASRFVGVIYAVSCSVTIYLLCHILSSSSSMLLSEGELVREGGREGVKEWCIYPFLPIVKNLKCRHVFLSVCLSVYVDHLLPPLPTHHLLFITPSATLVSPLTNTRARAPPYLPPLAPVCSAVQCSGYIYARGRLFLCFPLAYLPACLSACLLAYFVCGVAQGCRGGRLVGYTHVAAAQPQQTGLQMDGVCG